MAILKKKELRDMSLEELDEKLQELRDELFKERSKVASGGSAENPGRIKEIKRTIARILNIKKDKE